MTAHVIPVFALTEATPFLILIVAIISEAKKKRSIYELHHRERLAAIDKGMDVPALPPELFRRLMTLAKAPVGKVNSLAGCGASLAQW